MVRFQVLSWAQIALVLLLSAAPAAAAIYTIKPDGTGSFPTIQAGINAVQAGDILQLTDGTYRGAGNVDLEFLGKAITVRSQSGDARACVIDCEYASRGVSFWGGEGPDTRLESITITHGEMLTGGAIGAYSAPTLYRLILRENHAGIGGAIYT